MKTRVSARRLAVVAGLLTAICTMASDAGAQRADAAITVGSSDLWRGRDEPAGTGGRRLGHRRNDRCADAIQFKIVVTDDRGRHLIPDLPKGTYEVWVRGWVAWSTQPRSGRSWDNASI